jgi:predicted CoA-binding protein
MFKNPDAEARCALLKKTKTIAVVGLSPNAARPSHGVAQSMQGFGFRVIPVHPAAKEFLAKKSTQNLRIFRSPLTWWTCSAAPNSSTAWLMNAWRWD